MATAGGILPFSGKLTDDTLCNMDNDDVIQRLKNLMIQKEELKDKLEHKTMEMDYWQGILACTTKTELELQVPTSPASLKPFAVPLTPEQRDRLSRYRTLVAEIQALTFIENVSAHPMDDGGILVKFLRPPKNPLYNARLLLLDPGDGDTYSVRCHNLPDTVPVSKFEEKYLKQAPGEEEKDKNAGLKKFVTWLIQYVRPLYARQHQICSYQALSPSTSVYHNEACTFLCFTLVVKESVEEGFSEFEVVLEYDPCDILPLKVTIDHIGGAPASSDMKEIMNELRLQLQEEPFSQVLSNLLGSERTTSSKETTEAGRPQGESGSEDE